MTTPPFQGNISVSSMPDPSATGTEVAQSERSASDKTLSNEYVKCPTCGLVIHYMEFCERCHPLYPEFQ